MSTPSLEQSLWYPGGQWFRSGLIGEGSFGSVYLASVKTPVPRMFPGVSDLPVYLAVKSASIYECEDLKLESEILGKFRDCPFIIRSYGEDVTKGVDGMLKFNLFLEYAGEGTIGDLIKRNVGFGLPESQVREITEAILKGVKCIHDMGYVHCDLKPANILLVAINSSGSEFVPKIADFGLAKRVEVKDFGRGTTMYMSPECLNDQIQDQRSDIWSLGCIVLEMLTGRRPWDLKSGPEIPDCLSEIAKDFLGKCFEWNHSKRSTAAELLNHPFLAKIDGFGPDEPVEVEPEPAKVASSAPSLEAGATKRQQGRWKNILSSRFMSTNQKSIFRRKLPAFAICGAA